MFEGPVSDLGAEVWHSDATVVTEGGDKVWVANLTAPATEGNWTLTVFAYYLENGEWKYYANSDQGPGIYQITVKVARLATLEVALGEPNIPVNVDNSTKQTSSLGVADFQLPVGTSHFVAVPSLQPYPNSTRHVFVGWGDGINETHRILYLDGDTQIVGSYSTEYLVQVTSIVSRYNQSEWCDAGSNVTLKVEGSIPVGGVLAFLKLSYVFKGWSGDVSSNLKSVNVTIDKPKTISANFVIDYSQAAMPVILMVGAVGGLLLGVLGVRRKGAAVEVEPEQELEQAQEGKIEDETVQHGSALSRFCDGCGEPVEAEWSHCVHCGRGLGSSASKHA
jgi:hypothetical protein